MTVNIVKLCVGCESVDDLAKWQKARLAQMRRRNPKARLSHVTRSMPKRADEVLDGGSLFWVIKGYVRVRQRIIGLRAVRGEEGASACAIELAPRLIKTQLVAWRPFQGWRYLEAEDAPPDLPKRSPGDDDLPPKLAAALRELGLL
ncbi:MAG: DUF1489 family protein [Alphaproteobacteria bacterium]